jgi:hypothetical protein
MFTGYGVEPLTGTNFDNTIAPAPPPPPALKYPPAPPGAPPPINNISINPLAAGVNVLLLVKVCMVRPLIVSVLIPPTPLV